MLLIKVNEQFARKYNEQVIVADAVNFVQIQFEFDASWDGLNLTYQFTNGTTTIDVKTNDRLVNIPSEVAVFGTLYVKVFGTLLDTSGLEVIKRATMNPVVYDVIASKIASGTNAEPVTPSAYDQLYAIAMDANDKVTNVEVAVTNAANSAAQAARSAETVETLGAELSGIAEDVSFLTLQVGNEVLGTEAQTLSGAINELKAEKEVVASKAPYIESGTWWVWDNLGNTYTNTGIEAQGEAGIGINAITLSGTDENGGNIYTVTMSDGSIQSFTSPKGAKGDTGAPGAPGDPGMPGMNGTNGTNGVDGKSAYQVAVANGFSGTEIEWIASLVGAPGTPGTPGADGNDGYTPVRGTDYWTSADIAAMETYINTYIDTVILGGAS